MPIDKQSPGKHLASREKWTMSQDNATLAAGKNSMPQCHQKTTGISQKLHKIMERDPGKETKDRSKEYLKGTGGEQMARIQTDPRMLC